MRVWRIGNGKYAAAVFNGEGAYLYSGRWNPAAVRMVYTSTSLALAAVELFVHLEPATASPKLISLSATIPDDIYVAQIALDSLPANWKVVDNLELQQRGAEWIASVSSVALQVPSAVIPGEWNILLNPTHPDFARIIFDPSEPFVFDPRMFK